MYHGNTHTTSVQANIFSTCTGGSAVFLSVFTFVVQHTCCVWLHSEVRVTQFDTDLKQNPLAARGNCKFILRTSSTFRLVMKQPHLFPHFTFKLPKMNKNRKEERKGSTRNNLSLFRMAFKTSELIDGCQLVSTLLNFGHLCNAAQMDDMRGPICEGR